MRFWAHEVAAATGGRLHGPDVPIDGVSFDSRSVERGQLFVPIVAERDGHAFIYAALDGGAAAYLTSLAPGAGTAIEVPDTRRALMDLATALRARLEGPVVGITGSVGKTSTKDLARAAIGASRRVWANERSFNNEQGLPATVLNTPDDAEIVVLEMGMRGLGEIRSLCGIARPTVGVITRVAEAHSDRVGGIEGVARAKAELVESLSSSGTAVLNADDERVARMAAASAARVITFGTSASADVRIEQLDLDEQARASFVARTPWGSHGVTLGVSGRHMAMNAAAALAVAGVVGADLAGSAAALANVDLSAMRMQLHHTATGAIVLDDSYNANPTSMRAAIDALVDLPATRRIAVLGVMAEISDAEAEHRSVLAYALDRGVMVLPVGTAMYGIEPIPDPLTALGSLSGSDAVLVKGSRVAGLDRVAAALRV